MLLLQESKILYSWAEKKLVGLKEQLCNCTNLQATWLSRKHLDLGEWIINKMIFRQNHI